MAEFDQEWPERSTLREGKVQCASDIIPKG